LTVAAKPKRPFWPTSTGLYDRADATVAANTLVLGTDYDTAYTLTSKKYQYWAVKLKPYVETQLVITNKIYVDQIMQIDFTFSLESFKAYFWADLAYWYQYDSSNPTQTA